MKDYPYIVLDLSRKQYFMIWEEKEAKAKLLVISYFKDKQIEVDFTELGFYRDPEEASSDCYSALGLVELGDKSKFTTGLFCEECEKHCKAILADPLDFNHNDSEILSDCCEGFTYLGREWNYGNFTWEYGGLQ